MLHIRKSIPTDAEGIWSILQPIIAKGDAYVFAPTMPKQDMLNYWLSADKHTYTALEDDQIVGTFFMKDNQMGLGAHIANAGYATLPTVGGQGIGKAMGLFSMDEARRLGYQAMQFNIVVKTNERAVRLWQTIGFQIIGEIPEAFQHQTLGLVNAYVMYQKL
jgi:GNAT superfamily N-acetyltransferase